MNNKLSIRCLSIAKAMSPTVRQMRCSHIAFLIKKSKIVYIGWNKFKSHPITHAYPYKEYSYLHAEADVILKAGMEFLDDYEMLVVRFDKNGNLVNSKPCGGCTALIKQMGISKISYSNNNGEIITYAEIT